MGAVCVLAFFRSWLRLCALQSNGDACAAVATVHREIQFNPADSVFYEQNNSEAHRKPNTGMVQGRVWFPTCGQALL